MKQAQLMKKCYLFLFIVSTIITGALFICITTLLCLGELKVGAVLLYILMVMPLCLAVLFWCLYRKTMMDMADILQKQKNGQANN